MERTAKRPPEEINWLEGALQTGRSPREQAQDVRAHFFKQLSCLGSVRKFVQAYTNFYLRDPSKDTVELIVIMIEQGSALWNFGVPHFRWLTSARGLDDPFPETFSRGLVWLWQESRLCSPETLIRCCEAAVMPQGRPPRTHAEVADPFKALPLLHDVHQMIDRCREGFSEEEIQRSMPPDKASDDHCDWATFIASRPQRTIKGATIAEWHELVIQLEMPAAVTSMQAVAP